METWGAASPERLTFYVNRAFIEMNFSLGRPFTLFQPAIRGVTKQKIWFYQNSLRDSEWARYNQRNILCQSKNRFFRSDWRLLENAAR
ncbi:MAG TPA: hypothetical protein DDZ97_05190 [Deltaproteobacteria bacterium]|nr:hypothetical protein [Deltaproteobacteria bacterium]